MVVLVIVDTTGDSMHHPDLVETPKTSYRKCTDGDSSAQCGVMVATLPGQGYNFSSGSCISPRAHPVRPSILLFPCSLALLHGREVATCLGFS